MISSLSDIPYLLLQAAALIVGLVLHECSHALVAYLLGDKTARERGRMSLNPLNHIDPFGTVVLPLLMMIAGGPIFAFAKPVPVYLGNLKHPKRDEVLVSFAGPASNFVLAGTSALLLRFVYASSPSMLEYQSLSYYAFEYLIYFFYASITINLSLAFFNLIPLPPLDGSSILVPFLKGRAREQYYKIQRYSMPILIAVLYLLPTLINLDLVGIYFDFTVCPLSNWLVSLALGW